MAWVMYLIDNTDTAGMVGNYVLGRELPGAYLREFDVEAYAGRGRVKLTDDIERALRFPTREAVVATWRMQSRAQPRRADGKANRPLTAFSCEPREIP